MAWAILQTLRILANRRRTHSVNIKYVNYCITEVSNRFVRLVRKKSAVFICVNFLQIVGGAHGPFLPLPSLSSLPLLSPTLPSPPSPPLPSLSLSLEVGPQIQLGGLGKRCKLPQRGLGRSPSRNRIWCILALKSVIWWQQF